MTATKQKVELKNTFHGSTVNVIGELIGSGAEIQCSEGMACVRLSDSQAKSAQRKLCGIKECLCSRHQPHFEPEGNPSRPTTWRVIGKMI